MPPFGMCVNRLFFCLNLGFSRIYGVAMLLGLAPEYPQDFLRSCGVRGRVLLISIDISLRWSEYLLL